MVTKKKSNILVPVEQPSPCNCCEKGSQKKNLIRRDFSALFLAFAYTVSTFQNIFSIHLFILLILMLIVISFGKYLTPLRLR